MSDSSELASNTVYAIEPISGISRAGGSSIGDVFLTGCYDGICRYVFLRRVLPISFFGTSANSMKAL
jgi:hypothetical protein